MQVLNNFDLTDYNAYQLKAQCTVAYFPDTENDLIKIFSENTQAKKILLGGGNNIILSKAYYDEQFIIFNNCFNKVEINNTEIIAQAGATTLQINNVALENELTGFEIFYDIPSSIGGAVVMNAGTKVKEIKDILEKVRYIDLQDMQIKELLNKDIGFEYRNSFFQKHRDKVVLKAWFKLKQGNYNTIKKIMENEKNTRWDKQPRNFPNCGSVFKRPKGHYVGQMIEELGLKGFSIGGAKISEKHAGFIINYNNATGKDILDLIGFIQKKVKNVYNVDLEIEQRVI
ncbi:MAG: UDP-N-acetylmuramate dehydrogenase [Bacteroidales bacterium]|nr:UDP-N-acetylmuramate dehydrogenase [Bacteroidales bacterium]